MKITVNAAESEDLIWEPDPVVKNSVVALGWTPEDAMAARMRLLHFEEDWNYPGMEDYDEL